MISYHYMSLHHQPSAVIRTCTSITKHQTQTRRNSWILQAKFQRRPSNWGCGSELVLNFPRIGSFWAANSIQRVPSSHEMASLVDIHGCHKYHMCCIPCKISMSISMSISPMKIHPFFEGEITVSLSGSLPSRKVSPGLPCRQAPHRPSSPGLHLWGYPGWFHGKSQLKMGKWMITRGTPMTWESSIWWDCFLGSFSGCIMFSDANRRGVIACTMIWDQVMLEEQQASPGSKGQQSSNSHLCWLVNLGAHTN